MSEKSNNTMIKGTHDNAEALRNQQTVKRQIYPETSDKVKGLAIWLGLGFVAVVVILQQFSGYM
jgi:hypothetical protein